MPQARTNTLELLPGRARRDYSDARRRIEPTEYRKCLCGERHARGWAASQIQVGRKHHQGDDADKYGRGGELVNWVQPRSCGWGRQRIIVDARAGYDSKTTRNSAAAITRDYTGLAS